MPFRAPVLILAAAALLALCGPVSAETATATLGVRVVVQPSCTISGATLDFGTYSSGQSSDLRGFTQIGFSNCAAGRLNLELDGGANGSAGVRRLGDGGGSFLRYDLYRDSARTLPFGEGADARGVTLTTPGAGRISVYGVIPNPVDACGEWRDGVDWGDVSPGIGCSPEHGDRSRRDRWASVIGRPGSRSSVPTCRSSGS
jgi:spore coat protein U-like protein